jgi:hypothetical protein
MRAALRCVLFIGLFSMALVQADDNDSGAPTPPNQMQMDNTKNPAKTGVTPVQPQSAGPAQGAGSLDPSHQSSMGMGIQLPLGHQDNSAPEGSEKKDDDNSK